MISRANALLLPNSYRHAAHVMLHSPCRDDRMLFNYYPPRHAVLVSIVTVMLWLPLQDFFKEYTGSVT